MTAFQAARSSGIRWTAGRPAARGDRRGFAAVGPGQVQPAEDAERLPMVREDGFDRPDEPASRSRSSTGSLHAEMPACLAATKNLRSKAKRCSRRFWQHLGYGVTPEQLAAGLRCR